MPDLPAAQHLQERTVAAEKILRRLANRHRLMILCLLNDGERSVGEINQHIALSQSALSQHLAVLRQAGVVTTRRDSQTIYYQLSEGDVITLLASLCALSNDAPPAPHASAKGAAGHPASTQQPDKTDNNLTPTSDQDKIQ